MGYGFLGVLLMLWNMGNGGVIYCLWVVLERGWVCCIMMVGDFVVVDNVFVVCIVDMLCGIGLER